MRDASTVSSAFRPAGLLRLRTPGTGVRSLPPLSIAFRLIPAILLLVLASACGEAGAREIPEGADDPLLVMAATSLSTVMPELVAEFERQTGRRVEVVLGASGSLAAQVENGAPADLFFAADESTIDRLAARGLVRASTVRRYATGDLVMVWREGIAAPSSLAALADERYEVVAIANPETAPYGASARVALRRAGVWDDVRGRLVRGGSVSQTYQLVQTGNADVAIVARSLLDPDGAPFRALARGRGEYPRVRHTAGVLATSENRAAERFLDFVLGERGQTVLKRHGFGHAEP